MLIICGVCARCVDRFLAVVDCVTLAVVCAEEGAEATEEILDEGEDPTGHSQPAWMKE